MLTLTLLITISMVFPTPHISTVKGVSSDTCTRAARALDRCDEVSTNIGEDKLTIDGTRNIPGSEAKQAAAPIPEAFATQTENILEKSRSTAKMLVKSARTPMDDLRSAVAGRSLVEVWPDRFSFACVPGALCDPAAPLTEIIPGTPAVRISDLVSFTPNTPTQKMQPNGWMVKGLPTNFVATASAHQQTGDLLGQPADVRFTPVAYAWDYGDGTTGVFNTGGATWQQLNAAEFTDTATSHTYNTTGEYTITPSVIYAADYRYAGSTWLPVQGTITIPATPTTATTWIVRSALVAENCLDDPTGVGCRSR